MKAHTQPRCCIVLALLVPLAALAQGMQKKLPANAPLFVPNLASDVTVKLSRSLPGQQKLSLYNRARLDLQLPAVQSLPPVNARVSVAAPGHAHGPRLWQAKPSAYSGPSEQNPDGQLAMEAAGPSGAGGYVSVVFPAQGGRHYLLDCTVRTPGSSDVPIDFYEALGARAIRESAVPVDDHVIVVVQANGDRVARTLQSRGRWLWNACEIAPIP